MKEWKPCFAHFWLAERFGADWERLLGFEEVTDTTAGIRELLEAGASAGDRAELERDWPRVLRLTDCLLAGQRLTGAEATAVIEAASAQ